MFSFFEEPPDFFPRGRAVLYFHQRCIRLGPLLNHGAVLPLRVACTGLGVRERHRVKHHSYTEGAHVLS